MSATCAAVRIQAGWRGWAQNQRYVDTRFTCIVLQARWRGARDRASFLALRRAAVVVQKYRRQVVAVVEFKHAQRVAKRDALEAKRRRRDERGDDDPGGLAR